MLASTQASNIKPALEVWWPGREGRHSNEWEHRALATRTRRRSNSGYRRIEVPCLQP